MFPFDAPENIKKPKVFWCFQGDQKRTLGRKESRQMSGRVLNMTLVQWKAANKRDHG